MTKKLVFVILLLLIIGVYVVSRTGKTSESVTSAREAIALIQEKNPELKGYPSDNLPPKTIDSVQTATGWLLGFYTLGSGLPGILSAKCYAVTTDGTITKTGQFSANGKGGPDRLDLSSCTPGTTDVTAYFEKTITEEVKTTVPDYEKKGLAGGVDGFLLLKVYTKLLPSDFSGVQATGGGYSVVNGQLTYTGDMASNSAVITSAGMSTLLRNVSARLALPADNKVGVNRIMQKLRR
jgi:hypothetical protein